MTHVRAATALPLLLSLLLALACGGGDGKSSGTGDSTGDASPPPDQDTPDAPKDLPAPDPGPGPDDVAQDAALPGPGDVPLRGACPLAERYGGFLVEAQSEYSFVDGAVADGVLPITVLETTLVAGPCKLLRRNNPFCSPPCPAGDTCDHDGNCITFPEPQDLGTVTLEGLAVPLQLEPFQPGNSYFSTSVPHPVFVPGEVVRLSSTAGHYGALELWGVGVHLLEVQEEQWDLEEGQGLTIHWTAPPGDVRSHVYLTVNIDQHGNSPVILACEFPDTGTATVEADSIQALIDAGISGFPNGWITRRTADSLALGDGCMDLLISSPFVPDVRISGHTPCKSSEDCPSGQTCNVAIETCQSGI